MQRMGCRSRQQQVIPPSYSFQLKAMLTRSRLITSTPSRNPSRSYSLQMHQASHPRSVSWPMPSVHAFHHQSTISSYTTLPNSTPSRISHTCPSTHTANHAYIARPEMSDCNAGPGTIDLSPKSKKKAHLTQLTSLNYISSLPTPAALNLNTNPKRTSELEEM